MKGIVLNLLESAVTSAFGEDTWDELLEEAGLDGAYTSLGSYPDEHVHALVGVAAARLGRTPEEILRWFGEQAAPMFAERFPRFFAEQPDTRAFLLALNDVIHPEVLKLYPGADTPSFDFRQSAEAPLSMEYRSRRGLCALAHGLIVGVAAHYGEPLSVAHPECRHRHDERCLFELRFGA